MSSRTSNVDLPNQETGKSTTLPNLNSSNTTVKAVDSFPLEIAKTTLEELLDSKY